MGPTLSRRVGPSSPTSRLRPTLFVESATVGRRHVRTVYEINLPSRTARLPRTDIRFDIALILA